MRAKHKSVYHQKHCSPNFPILGSPEKIIITNCGHNICHILQNCYHCNIYVLQTASIIPKEFIKMQLLANYMAKCLQCCLIIVATDNAKRYFVLARFSINRVATLQSIPITSLVYLYMPDTSMPTKIMLTGIQTRMRFQLSFSTEINPHILKATTMIVLIKFCNKKKRMALQMPHVYMPYNIHLIF